MKSSKKLNIGCGNDIKESFLNLDSIKLPGVDIVHDLTKYPWPFKDNTFEEVLANHVLEHLPDIVKSLEEIWRISKKGARIKIEVPIFPSINSVRDPTHKSFYNYYTFDYFKQNSGYEYYSKAKFKILNRKIIFSKFYLIPFTGIINLSEFTKKVYSSFFSFIIPARVLRVELEVIK